MNTLTLVKRTNPCLWRSVKSYSGLWYYQPHKSCWHPGEDRMCKPCTAPMFEYRTYQLKQIVEDGNNFIIRLNAKPDITTQAPR